MFMCMFTCLCSCYLLAAIPQHTPSDPFCHGNGCKILESSTGRWSDIKKRLETSTVHKNWWTLKNTTYLHFRVQGVTCQFKSNLIISLTEKTKNIVNVFFTRFIKSDKVHKVSILIIIWQTVSDASRNFHSNLRRTAAI